MAGTPGDETIKLSLDDTLAFLKKADAELAAEVLTEVSALAEEAAVLARAHATEQGFAAPGKSGRGTGRLIESIGSSRRGLTAYLRETAVSPDGYKYPAVFEYGRKAEWMNRPFLFPAIKDLEPVAYDRVEKALTSAIERL